MQLVRLLFQLIRAEPNWVTLPLRSPPFFNNCHILGELVQREILERDPGEEAKAWAAKPNDSEVCSESIRVARAAVQ